MLVENKEMEWSNSEWKDGRESTVITYQAVPGSVQSIDPQMVSLLKGLYRNQITLKGNKKVLNGVVYFEDNEGNNVNVFTCNSENIHDVFKNNGYQWAGGRFTRATPGDVCIVLPNKGLGYVAGYKFVLHSISK